MFIFLCHWDAHFHLIIMTLTPSGTTPHSPIALVSLLSSLSQLQHPMASLPISLPHLASSTVSLFLPPSCSHCHTLTEQLSSSWWQIYLCSALINLFFHLSVTLDQVKLVVQPHSGLQLLYFYVLVHPSDPSWFHFLICEPQAPVSDFNDNLYHMPFQGPTPAGPFHSCL